MNLPFDLFVLMFLSSSCVTIVAKGVEHGHEKKHTHIKKPPTPHIPCRSELDCDVGYKCQEKKESFIFVCAKGESTTTGVLFSKLAKEVNARNQTTPVYYEASIFCRHICGQYVITHYFQVGG